MFKKVLLVQFSIPTLNTLEYRSNVHLAPGYLVGYAREHCPDTEFVIAPRIYTDILSEKAFIDYAVDCRPDLISFSLYLWNIEKTLRVVKALKALMPEVQVIYGGPEVTADNTYLISSPEFTEGISGEGEIAFTDYVLGKPKDEIAGLLTKDSYNDYSTIRKEYPIHTNPYIAGLIEIEPDDTMFFETVRGCPFSCKFCYYSKMYNTIVPVGQDSLELLFSYAREKGFEELFILDPTFNVQRGFSELLDKIATLNSDKQFRISTELRSDFLSDEEIEKLAEINLVEAEIGLQSTNPVARKSMGREGRMLETIERTKKMVEAGIECKVDLIVGLPGDSLAGFKQSVDDVHDHEINDYVQVFRLSVLPGTDFSLTRKELGLQGDFAPPYYIDSTPTFSAPEIQEALEYAEDVFDVSLYPIAPYLLSTDYSELDKGEFVSFASNLKPIHKLIVREQADLSGLDTMLFCESLVIHFVIPDGSLQSDLIEQCLAFFSRTYPENTYQIILDFETEPSRELIDVARKNMPRCTSTYIAKDIVAHFGVEMNLTTRLCVIVPESVLANPEMVNAIAGCDSFIRITECNEERIDELSEEFNLFFTGEAQLECFEYLNEQELLDDFCIFDSFAIEKQKIELSGPTRLYYPHIKAV